MSRPLLRIGTRGSPLALAQAHETARRLAAAHDEFQDPAAIEIVVIKTTGDRILDRTLAEAGGKGLFTKEIEEALAAGEVDIAVHSMKDVPTWLPDGMEIACLLPREDPRDAWFSRSGATLESLPENAVVGTASLRRQAQVLVLRPDLRVVPLRGNVQTRFRKLDDGEADATLLALAGLRRLGEPRTPTQIIEPSLMLPAVAQGAIGIEIRSADDHVRRWIAPLHCETTGHAVAAERAFLTVLDGSCRTPIAGHATIGADGTLAFEGLVLASDGSRSRRAARRGPATDAAALGADAGEEVKADWPREFFGAPSGTWAT